MEYISRRAHQFKFQYMPSITALIIGRIQKPSTQKGKYRKIRFFNIPFNPSSTRKGATEWFLTKDQSNSAISYVKI